MQKRSEEDRSFTVEFDDIESVSKNLFVDLAQRVNEIHWVWKFPRSCLFEYLKLDEFKRLKGKKVFTENGRMYVDKLFDAVAKNDLKTISELIKGGYNKIPGLFYLCEIIHLKKYRLPTVTILIQRSTLTGLSWMITQE